MEAGVGRGDGGGDSAIKQDQHLTKGKQKSVTAINANINLDLKNKETLLNLTLDFMDKAQHYSENQHFHKTLF